MRISEIISEDASENFYRDQVVHSMVSRIKRNNPDDTSTVSKITGLRKDHFWTKVLEPRISKRDYPQMFSLPYWNMIDELISLAKQSNLPVDQTVEEGPKLDKLKKSAKTTAKAAALAAGILTYGGLPREKHTPPQATIQEPKTTIIYKNKESYPTNKK